MNHTLKILASAALLATASRGQSTNIVYTIHATPPQVYATGQRLMLNLSWDVAPNARGFAHLRFLSQDPESIASPAFSMLINANGTFDMVQADRAPVLNLQNLTASGAAASHAVAVQVYPSANTTKFAGDYFAIWPHRLDTAAVSGNVEVLICGEGLSLATMGVRWTTNPTLFLLK